MAFSFNSYSYTDIFYSYIDERSLYPFNCTVISSSSLISALCNLPNSPFAVGIQVIVQSINVSEVHKLYVNKSIDLDTPVTVSVEPDGDYQVTIFAIRRGIGILESDVGYTEHVMVHTPAVEPTKPSPMTGLS